MLKNKTDRLKEEIGLLKLVFGLVFLPWIFPIGLAGRASGGRSSTEVRFGGDTAEIGSDVSGFSGGAGATGMVGYVYISTELPSGDQAQN